MTFITTDDGIGDQAAGHVHAGPADRHVALGDGRARRHPRHRLSRDLGLVHQPGPPRGLGQRGPQRRVQAGQRGGQAVPRHPGGGQVNAVERGGMLADRVGAAAPDVLADRAARRPARRRRPAGRGAAPRPARTRSARWRACHEDRFASAPVKPTGGLRRAARQYLRRGRGPGPAAAGYPGTRMTTPCQAASMTGPPGVPADPSPGPPPDSSTSPPGPAQSAGWSDRLAATVRPPHR